MPSSPFGQLDPISADPMVGSWRARNRLALIQKSPHRARRVAKTPHVGKGFKVARVWEALISMDVPGTNRDH
jgi:hypothetical protein